MSDVAQSYFVKVMERAPGRRRHDHFAVLGEDISINTSHLDEYCFAESTPFAYDFMSLLGAVRFADRRFRRRHALGWSRHIAVEIPMFEPSRWNARAGSAALADCLNFLTGDNWQFRFTARRNRPPRGIQAPARLQNGHFVFVPYSHGLDSYAQVRLLQANASRRAEVVCVFTEPRQSGRTWKEFCRTRFGKELRDVPVPVTVREPHHAEASFRSRPFMYYSLAAHGALQSGSNLVLVPENGQGSLGGSLLPLGGEAMHRSCHPGFTARLHAFLKHLTGISIQFEHPALFDTKAQVLTRLADVEPNANQWLREHYSCSHDQRHANRDGKRIHCGVCGNCLLRRMSLVAAGIQDSTPYKFERLSASTIEEAIELGDSLPRSLTALRDVAGNSTRTMQRFGDLARDPYSPTLWGEAASIAPALNADVKQVHGQVLRLLATHKEEWERFMSYCGPQSWINAYAS